MKKLYLEAKAFFGNKGFLLITVAFFGIIFGKLFKTTSKMLQILFEEGDDVFMIVFSDSQKISYFLFVFFIFISYELFYLSHKSNLNETLKTTKKGIRNTYFYQYLIIFIITAIITVCIFALNIYSAAHFKVLTTELLIHIILNCLLNITLVITLASSFGFLLSLFSKKVFAYISIVFIAFFSSEIFKDIVSTLLEGFGLDLYHLTDLFVIFPPNMKSVPIYAFGLSVLPYRWNAVLFWLFLCLGFINLKLIRNRKKNISKTVSTILLFAFAVVNLCFYYTPQSKVIRDNSPYQTNFADFIYYSATYTGDEINQKADFNITGYEMDLKIRNTLSADVTVTIDKSDNEKYIFTLYHGYEVKSVTDENGNSMAFTRDNDVLTVESDSHTNSMRITYSGYSPRYYSNLQGICLPAGFVFYPVEGSVVLYDTENQDFIPYISENLINFDVNIDYYKNCFSNLKENDTNRFEGKSNSLSIVSGLYKEMVVEDTRFVYPYLSGSNNEKNFRELIINEINPKKYNINGKSVIITPNLNQSNICVFAEDHIVAHKTPWGLAEEANGNAKEE